MPTYTQGMPKPEPDDTKVRGQLLREMTKEQLHILHQQLEDDLWAHEDDKTVMRELYEEIGLVEFEQSQR